ncbi:MAG: hypothetical protein ACREKH_05370 [Candidatus Rokuibacteriota bacterium]
MGRFKRRLREAEAAIEAGYEEGKRAVAAEVAEEWRRDAPVDTGAFKRSIRSDADSAFTDIDYAPFVEFGTSTRPARPVGRAAAARVERKVGGIVAKAIRRRLPR